MKSIKEDEIGATCSTRGETVEQVFGVWGEAVVHDEKGESALLSNSPNV